MAMLPSQNSPKQQTVGGGGGRTLSEPSSQPSSSHVETSRPTTAIELPPEPDKKREYATFKSEDVHLLGIQLLVDVDLISPQQPYQIHLLSHPMFV